VSSGDQPKAAGSGRGTLPRFVRTVGRQAASPREHGAHPFMNQYVIGRFPWPVEELSAKNGSVHGRLTAAGREAWRWRRRVATGHYTARMSPQKVHQYWPAPKSDHVRLWRFMSLGKFVQLRHSRSLYFARLDQFNDPYERFPPAGFVGDRAFNFGIDPAEEDRHFRRRASKTCALHYANCWYSSDHEPAALWHQYPGDETLAVRSSVRRFSKSIEATSQIVYCGLVEYVDFYNKWWTEPADFHFVMIKRASFAHEREFRAVVVLDPPAGEMDIEDLRTAMPRGIEVPVDLEVLIDDIVMAPTAPSWMTDVLRDLIAKYGQLRKILRQSDLYRLRDLLN
jgi:hypothetical protein